MFLICAQLNADRTLSSDRYLFPLSRKKTYLKQKHMCYQGLSQDSQPYSNFNFFSLTSAAFADTLKVHRT